MDQVLRRQVDMLQAQMAELRVQREQQAAVQSEASSSRASTSAAAVVTAPATSLPEGAPGNAPQRLPHPGDNTRQSPVAGASRGRGAEDAPAPFIDKVTEPAQTSTAVDDQIDAAPASSTAELAGQDELRQRRLQRFGSSS